MGLSDGEWYDGAKQTLLRGVTPAGCALLDDPLVEPIEVALVLADVTLLERARNADAADSHAGHGL
jgi:hypothetical protein